MKKTPPQPLSKAPPQYTAPAAGAARTPDANEPSTRKRIARLAIESLLIVLSVLLGFAANQWHDRSAERELSAQALDSFRRELRRNLASLDSAQPRHAAMANRLDSAAKIRHAGQTAFDDIVAAMPAGGVSTPQVGDAAWQTAVSTGALRLLGYERVSRLSETYEAQRSAVGSTGQRLEDRLSSPQNFDPAFREQMLRAQSLIFRELGGQELYLMGVYRRTLTALDSTAK